MVRTTVDIPDPIYRRLKASAALRGCSVRQLILESVATELEDRTQDVQAKRISLPLIKSKRPGSLKLSNQKINEILMP